MKHRQIIAIGGSGFAKPDEEPVFETYILAQTKARRPRIAFFGTATGDSPKYIANFYATFSRLNCRPSHIPLFERTPDLRKSLLTQDAIFVGGGNTKSMLTVWREWGIDKILREAWEKGIVLSGVSAGAICWFEQGVTDSWAETLKPLDCLGFIKGSCCPHYSGEKDRRPLYHRLMKTGKIAPGIAIDDGVAVHFSGQHIRRIACIRKKMGAYNVAMIKGKVCERRIV